jgi:hypothetical protein
MFNLPIDLAGIDEEINKAEKMIVRLQKIDETQSEQAEETRKQEGKKTTYIS